MYITELLFGWKEFYTEDKSGKRTFLRELLVKPAGTKRLMGFECIQFEAANEEIGYLCLRPEEDADGAHCKMWDGESVRWIDLGVIRYVNEWGNYQLQLRWEICAIRIARTETMIALADMFQAVQGERYEGILFEGKGDYEGEFFILRLPEVEKPLQDPMASQRCERYNKRTGEWELFGELLKKRPVTHRRD